MGSQKNLGEVRKFSLLYRADFMFKCIFNQFKNKVFGVGWVYVLYLKYFYL